MKDFICKLFGHKWTYYVLYNLPDKPIDLRVCRCCHEMQEWKVVLDRKKPIWSVSIQYRDRGAKLHVEGYGK